MSSYASRMRLYLAEMYPVPRRAFLALLLASAFGTLLARVQHTASPPPFRFTLTAAASAFLLLLILRLMDELKDYDLDRALFAQRPLPSGRVKVKDLSLTLTVLALAYVPLHGPHPGPLASAALALGYAFLMFGWFFAPQYLRPRLLPTLATHNPIVGLMLLHLAVLFAAASGLEVLQLRGSGVAAAVVLLWAPAFAWEIARKIRAPGEETAYVTYSRVLGPRRAVVLAIGAQATAVGASLFLFAVHGLSPALVLLSAAGFLGALFGHLRFLRAPGPRTSRLAPFAEAQLLVTLVGGCLA